MVSRRIQFLFSQSACNLVVTWEFVLIFQQAFDLIHLHLWNLYHISKDSSELISTEKCSISIQVLHLHSWSSSNWPQHWNELPNFPSNCSQSLSCSKLKFHKMALFPFQSWWQTLPHCQIKVNQLTRPFTILLMKSTLCSHQLLLYSMWCFWSLQVGKVSWLLELMYLLYRQL